MRMMIPRILFESTTDLYEYVFTLLGKLWIDEMRILRSLKALVVHNVLFEGNALS